jgi:hypothetical protein
MVVGSNLCLFGVNGVVHGRVCSNLCLFGGQWWCSAWSWVRIFNFLDVNGDVVHGRGFESLIFGASGGVLHDLVVESLTFLGSMVV